MRSGTDNVCDTTMKYDDIIRILTIPIVLLLCAHFVDRVVRSWRHSGVCAGSCGRLARECQQNTHQNESHFHQVSSASQWYNKSINIQSFQRRIFIDAVGKLYERTQDWPLFPNVKWLGIISLVVPMV